MAKNDAQLWHRRFAHICDENLRKIKNEYDFEFQMNLAQCEVCLQGKQVRNSFKENGHRANEVLELVHSDVMGPFRTKSFSGARFIVIIVDDYSRKVFLSPIKNKSDFFEEFKKFKATAENHCSNKIKIFRTDNGTEYTSNAFQKFLNGCGIIHQKTAPYTSEQNGVSERLNRTIIDRVRCMLIDSGLEEKFWAEAAKTASYLLNRTPCRNNTICPEELWSGRKPSLKHIRVFGCKAFVHIP